MDKVLRYAGTALGLAMVALIVVFAIGDGVPNVVKQPRVVQIEFAAMGIMMLGALLALKWSRLGGLAMIGGYAVFTAAEWSTHGTFKLNLFAIFAAAGAILLLAPPAPNLTKSGQRLQQPHP